MAVAGPNGATGDATGTRGVWKQGPASPVDSAVRGLQRLCIAGDSRACANGSDRLRSCREHQRPLQAHCGSNSVRERTQTPKSRQLCRTNASDNGSFVQNVNRKPNTIDIHEINPRCNCLGCRNADNNTNQWKCNTFRNEDMHKHTTMQRQPTRSEGRARGSPKFKPGTTNWQKPEWQKIPPISLIKWVWG